MRTLLLDRDGVINVDSTDFIRSPADFVPIPGSLEAIARARKSGMRILVFSNQSGLARGLLTVKDLNDIHAKLLQELVQVGGRIDAFFYCPHMPDDNCNCRKPRAGMLEMAQQRLGISFAGQPFVGDRLSDVEAAMAVSARPLLVRTGLSEADPGSSGAQVFPDLAHAVDAIL